MARKIGSPHFHLAALAAALGAWVGCSTSAPGTAGTDGSSASGGAAGTAGVVGAAGTFGDAQGSAGAGGLTADAAGDDTAPAAGATGHDASLDQTGSTPEAAAGKTPICVTNDVAGGMSRAAMNYVECNKEDQAVDFDVAANYANYTPVRKPGYDPAETPITITDYGTAFTGAQVQECHPYCYKGNLTIGVDLIAGTESSLRGEVIFDLPPAVTPVTNGPMRNTLGWIFLDGPPLPAGTTLKAQMVLKSKDKGIVVAADVKTLGLKTWVEFRYVPASTPNVGFATTDLVNLTSIGFRVTMVPAAGAAKDWHGVIYADHFQLRNG